MNKLFAVSQLALCFVLMFCISSSGQNRPSELVGHWEHASGATRGKPEKLELFKDGTGVVDGGGSISWKVENKRLVLLSPMQGLVCNYKVSGYELTLAYDDGNSAIFVRKGKLGEFKAKQAAAAEAEKAKKIAEAKRALEQLPKFTDSRDSKVYRKVTIGSQTWMAENLNYAANSSVCYENSAENCAKYGRLYDWATAKTACPAGWHLPSDEEWTTLENTVGGRSTAGTKLKLSAGWNNDGNGTNEYLFSALPGGNGGSDGDFSNAGNYGIWWSSTEKDARNAWYWLMSFSYKFVDMSSNDKADLFSVRCVQD